MVEPRQKPRFLTCSEYSILASTKEPGKALEKMSAASHAVRRLAIQANSAYVRTPASGNSSSGVAPGFHPRVRGETR